jgi:hypothetical protein
MFGKKKSSSSTSQTPSASAAQSATQPDNSQQLAAMGQPGDKRMAERKQVNGQTQDIANQDVVMEQLAHKGAYGRLDNRKLAGWGYREAGALTDPESGFRAVVYLPTDEALANDTDQARVIHAIHQGPPPPVVAFRGTAEKRGVQDDTTKAGIGAYQFASNEGRIRDALGMAGGKAIVTGHSLGGSLAQLAATHYPGSVGRVVSFQAPGIPEEEVEKLRRYNAQAAPEDQISSTHHRAGGDVVHMAGESLTDGDVYTYESKGMGTPIGAHKSFPLARLNAARGGLVEGADGKGGSTEDKLMRVEKTSSRDEKDSIMARISEGVRKKAGGAVRDSSMDKYVKVWKDVKAMAESGAYSTRYVLSIVQTHDNLNEDQKVKMRDNVLRMYPDRQSAPAT